MEPFATGGKQLEIIPDMYRHKFLRRPAGTPGQPETRLCRVQWNDILIIAPIGSAQLSTVSIANVKLIMVQLAAVWNIATGRPFAWVRDGVLGNPTVITANKGIELQAGQMLTLEADDDEILDPRDYYVLALGPAPSILIHVGIGVRL